MPVEFIGLISTRDFSETRVKAGPTIDRDYVRRLTRAHEDSDFDRVLIGYQSGHPDGLQVAAYAAAHSERLGFLVAHRPGFVFPTVAARSFASLDHFSDGRIALHTITGGIDAEQRRDGDFFAKEERYARTDEYLEILRKSWTSTEPFSHEGTYYRFEDFVSDVRPFRESGIPIYFGGSSEAAYRIGGRRADTFALFAEPLAETAEQIASVRAAALAAGRAEPPGISISFRPILGATEELAWARAHEILEATKANLERGANFFKRFNPNNERSVGSQRLLAAVDKGERHDRALWTELAKATGAMGNSNALVGTPETVAQALLDYVDIGATTLLIRGYDPYDDAVDYGRELIPLVREELRRREAGAARQDAEPALATAN
jgi:alkanesulfonate monooxygenase